MIVLLHVMLALGSIANATNLYFKPSKAKYTASYGLVGATLVSGTYLVISAGSPLLSSCMSGLIYLGIVTTIMVAARHKAPNR